MNLHTNAYKQNIKVNTPMYEKVISILRKAEAASEKIVSAIDANEILKRYEQSEQLIKALVELHDMFDNSDQENLKSIMQKYCVQNINLVSKLNLKNDRELAVALRESFFEIANLWGSYKFSF